MAAGGALSYAAVRDVRKAARLPRPREDLPSPADPANLVRRAWSRYEGGKGLGQ
jgi:hypothetical protein